VTLDTFIAQVWSANLLENLNDKHVYVSLLNRDFEGEIRASGDSVRINSIGRVTIQNYTKNGTLTAPETLDGDGQVLIVDQAKAFNFEIDDVDQAQGKPAVMSGFMEEAAWGLADVRDDFAAALIVAGVATANKLTAATSVGVGASDNDAYGILVDLDVQLTINNTPSGGRWAVVPPWFHGVLRKDPRFVSFGTGENRGTLKNGVIGQVANLTIHQSNNVPVSGSDYTIVAGHASCGTFAAQITDVEGFRPEASFGDAMKGLDLYGAKLTRPQQVASIVATAA
jgi:hypothetical protein